MTDRTLSQKFQSTDKSLPDKSLQRALQTASVVKKGWHGGVPANLAEVLESHPELKNHRTVVLELAYEEYCLRLNAGESLDPEEFSRRFRSFERSLYFFIAVHSLLGKDPEFVALNKAAQWPEPGSHFLGFDLICELGRGAIGRVFLASEPALGNRQVVVKVAVHGNHEAEILARLRHANIVPVYSIQEDIVTGLTAFCMPYMGHATLTAVLDGVYADHRHRVRARSILDLIHEANRGAELPESPLPDRILRKGSYVDGVIYLAVQLAEALSTSHSCGIYHRDLKPSNVLMSPDGRPLLLDFNLSVDDRHPVWRIGGTLPYMAPEELSYLCDESARKGSSCYDHRSDLFSLGIIIYELLAGCLPYGEIKCNGPTDEIAAELRQRQEKGPRPLRDHNRRVDKRLARLIDRCLAFDPARRPQNADELATALRKELTSTRRLWRWSSFHRPIVLATALVTTSLLLGAATFFALRPPYSVRQLQEGVAYYEAGRDDLALECLNASLRAEPKSSKALMARASVYKHQGDYQMAFDDYAAASLSSSSPSIDAQKGYCLNQIGQHRLATAYYQNSLAAGNNSAAVLNNLGFSWFQLVKLDEAEDTLRLAVQVDDTLQAPHHNLVLVYLERAYGGKSIPPEALTHARRAEEIGPQSGELYHSLALVYAMAAKRDPSLSKLAIEYVAKAVSFGIDPETIRSNPTFSSLKPNPDFVEALIVRGATPSRVEAIYLVDPEDETKSIRR